MVTPDPMHDEESTKMSTMGVLGELTRLEVLLGKSEARYTPVESGTLEPSPAGARDGWGRKPIRVRL
jgi:hypothetical protein